MDRAWLVRYWKSFSFVGLAVATLFFAASLSPSLLPRQFAVQGVLSGFALSVGYGLGVLFEWLWLGFEIPQPGDRWQRVGKWITVVAVAVVTVTFLWRASVWQNSILELMEMEPVTTAYPLRVAAIAVLLGLLLVAIVRGLAALWRWVHRQICRVAPPRVSYLLSTIVVVLTIVLLVNDVIARWALNAADRAFLKMDQIVDEGIEQPADPAASGSAESLVDWDTIGRYGKQFVAAGPTQESIAEFWEQRVSQKRPGEGDSPHSPHVLEEFGTVPDASGIVAKRPLRVYVGLDSRETVQGRAQLALEELKRAGGFTRSLLVIATPTGTGWLDPGAVDTLEYLHAGDTAIVTVQYSYLPSWLTILVDPTRSRDSATYLFEAVYGHWTTLPKDSRPRLYVHGLSLGSLGSAGSADLMTLFEDPIQGGVWSGPPFPNAHWARATKYRNPDSPMWLPTVRDGAMLRFTGRESSLEQGGRRWGPMRFVYIQHASDPMTFFSPDLAYQRPEWLIGQRGPDVSPYLQWYPIVTFLQSAFDLPMATSVPAGYGHNYAPSSYIDAWIAVSAPKNWNDERTARLKERFGR